MDELEEPGRPEVYTDQQLKDILLQFTVENPGKKINPFQLEKESGIKRHVWSRRMKRIIDDLNTPVEKEFGGKEGSLPLPNVAELVEMNWNNKNKLIQSLSHINELIQSMYEQALLYHNKCSEYEELEQKFNQITLENNQLKERVKHLEKKYMEVAVQSTYSSIQKEQGLKNIIQLKSKSIDQPGLSTNFKKDFKDLFE